MYQTYKPSGKVSWVFFPVLLLFLLIFIPSVSFIYVYILCHSPSVIVNGILYLAALYLIALLGNRGCIRLGKLRNLKLAGLSGLNWGTRNQEEIRAAIRKLEEGQTENSEDEWEVIKKISAEFPDLKPDHMLLLDKDYKPVGEKYYMDEKFIPVITEQVRSRYPKINPQASHITDDIPAASVYNKMIDLALQYQVYEYIGTHCKDEDYAPLFNPGYFTFIGDPMTFLEAMNRRNIVLAEGEYPLIAGLMLLTTKGCWNKKEFMPWDEFTLDAAISSLGEIETRVNGKCIVEFKVNTQYYQDKETFTKEDMVFVKQIELDDINHFLKGLKKLSGT